MSEYTKVNMPIKTDFFVGKQSRKIYKLLKVIAIMVKGHYGTPQDTDVPALCPQLHVQNPKICKA